MPVNIYSYIPYYSILYIPKNLTFPISIRGLECTELPPYADALRSETKLPVFDAITNADCRGGRGRGATVEKSSGKAMDFLPWKLQIRWKFLDFLQGKYANLQKIPENSDVFSIFSQRMWSLDSHGLERPNPSGDRTDELSIFFKKNGASTNQPLMLLWIINGDNLFF